MKTPSRRTFLASTLGEAALSVTPARASAQQEPGVATKLANPKQPLKGSKTQFALNIEMWLRNLPFTDRIRAAADLGFQWVEFWPWQGKDLSAIKQICTETEVRVSQFTGWGFVPGMNNPANHEAFEKGILAGCKVAQELGAPMMTVVAGNDQPGMTSEQMHEHIITGLKRVAPIAEAHKVMLILEPMNIRVDHKGHSLYGSPDAIRICREVNSPMVKINWDLYHMQISEGDLCGRMKEGFDQIGYFQLADHPGRHEPGTGEIHYNRVLKEAWNLGYRGPIGVECSPSGPPLESATRLALADIW